MKITKLLALNAKPAKALLSRAKTISLTYAERQVPPKTFSCADGVLENALGPVRPLEVGDVLLDEKGGFYVVQAAPDRLMRVRGDARMLQEAAYAFSARGVRYARTEDGFAMIENEQFRTMLTSVGLKTEPVVAPFIPEALPVPEDDDACCCCGHHHHDGECGCHHHDHEEDCGCGCHHHDHGEDCDCGCHHHDHGEDCDCGCRHHDHDDDCDSECHHHDHEEDCGCGCHHHDHDKGSCGQHN